MQRSIQAELPSELFLKFLRPLELSGQVGGRVAGSRVDQEEVENQDTQEDWHTLQGAPQDVVEELRTGRPPAHALDVCHGSLTRLLGRRTP